MTRLFLGACDEHTRPAGWTVVGLDQGSHLRLDVAHQPLPLPPDSVDLIVVAHELDRVPPARLGFVLGELRRVIRPGGWRDSADGSKPFEGGLIRITVPDLAAACRAYVENKPEFFADGQAAGTSKDQEPMGVRLVDWLRSRGVGGMGLLHAFDHDSLLWWLKREGFDGMYRSAYKKSLLPELRVEGLDRRPHDSLFIEAWKTRRAA
jgi:SAM-dependent methyltransferase